MSEENKKENVEELEVNKSQKENPYVKLELLEDGNWSVESNLNALGIVHTMAGAQQMIINNYIEQATSASEEPPEQGE